MLSSSLGKKTKKTGKQNGSEKNQTQTKPFIIYCGVLFQNCIHFNILPAQQIQTALPIGNLFYKSAFCRYQPTSPQLTNSRKLHRPFNSQDHPHFSITVIYKHYSESWTLSEIAQNFSHFIGEKSEGTGNKKANPRQRHGHKL